MERKCSKIPFDRGLHIYVVKDGDGGIGWISLYDLCRILNRKEQYENGEIFRICPCTKDFPVYSNGKLYRFIRQCDVPAFLCRIRQENQNIVPVCDRIEKWLVSLPESHAETMIPAPETKLDMIPLTFTFREQPVSFMTGRNGTFFNATQMARGFGKHPREWLLLAETQRFRQSLVRRGKSENLESQLITTRGSLGATWMEYSLGLEFARWLSPEFSLWCDERIRELISRGYVIFRKEDDDGRTERFPVPKTFRETLQLAVMQQEEIERQQCKIAEDRPKVAFYTDFIENREVFKSSIIAEELRITTVALHRFLTEEKICRYERRQYVAYPAYAALQCDFPYMWTNRFGKTYICSHAKRWTKAGREYILELYRKKNPL
jgi:phage antirepressor YoqD-like protein